MIYKLSVKCQLHDTKSNFSQKKYRYGQLQFSNLVVLPGNNEIKNN